MSPDKETLLARLNDARANMTHWEEILHGGSTSEEVAASYDAAREAYLSAVRAWHEHPGPSAARAKLDDFVRALALLGAHDALRGLHDDDDPSDPVYVANFTIGLCLMLADVDPEWWNDMVRLAHYEHIRAHGCDKTNAEHAREIYEDLGHLDNDETAQTIYEHVRRDFTIALGRYTQRVLDAMQAHDDGEIPEGY